MAALAEAVGDLVRLNGGTLIGKTRLQKTAYLLESRNLGFGFYFEYYHYGPYSEELSVAAGDALALNIVDLAWKNTTSGVQYAVYTCANSPSGDLNALDVIRKR